jgi:protein-tyrosine phosphatase
VTRPGGEILVVCTGNVCRSPFVERRLRHLLRSTEIVIGSAGTEALVGAPMDEQAAAQLASGGDPAGFVARQLEPDLVARADLVLTATRKHRGAVAVLSPGAMRRTFALGDFADLVAGLSEDDLDADAPHDRVRQVAELAARRRSVVAPRATAAVDIVDPYGRPHGVFVSMAGHVTELLRPVARVLAY